jgi:hypothetical protein
MGQNGLSGDKDSPHIDGDHPIEIGKIVIVDHTANENPGIVHQDVEAAEPLNCLCNGGFDGGLVGTVGADRDRRSPGSLDFRYQAVRLFACGGIGKNDRGAVVGQPPYDRGADAAGSAGNEGNLTG